MSFIFDVSFEHRRCAVHPDLTLFKGFTGHTDRLKGDSWYENDTGLTPVTCWSQIVWKICLHLPVLGHLETKEQKQVQCPNTTFRPHFNKGILSTGILETNVSFFTIKTRAV